jgi:hypothetical protein
MKGDHLVGKYYVEFDKAYKAEIADLVAKGIEKEEAEKKPAAVEVKTNVAPKEQYININEEMVKQKIDDAMDKFCCCKCELCRQDVTIMTLNNMTPNYMYIKPYETAAAAKKMDFSETTKALMKSILHVKTHARH